MVEKCPTDDVLLEFLDSELPPEAEVAVLRHLSSCPSCLEKVLEMRRELESVTEALELTFDGWESFESEMKAVEDGIIAQLKDEGVIVRARPDIRKQVLRAAGQVGRVAGKAARVGAKVSFAMGKALFRGAGYVVRPALSRLELAF